MRAKRGSRKNVYTEPGPGARINRQQFPSGTASAVRSAIRMLEPDEWTWYVNNTEASPTIIYDKGEVQFQGFQQHQHDPKMKKGTDPVFFWNGSGRTGSRAGDENLDQKLLRGLNAVYQDFGGGGFSTKKVPKKQITEATTRMSTPWWVLDEDLFKNFVGRHINPALFEKVAKQGVRPRDVKHLRQATRCYIALSEFFLDGRSDEEILETNPKVWGTALALRLYRNHRVKEGNAEYGTKGKPKNFVWRGRHFDLEWAIIRGDESTMEMESIPEPI